MYGVIQQKATILVLTTERTSDMKYSRNFQVWLMEQQIDYDRNSGNVKKIAMKTNVACKC